MGSYPQKQWRKRKYQYLKYFLQPKRFDPESEMHTISQVENPSALNTSSNIPPNEDSNTSDRSGKEWPYYDEDGFMDDDDEDQGARNSDSDFEYEDSNSRKRKSGRGSTGRGNSRSRGGGGPGNASKVNFGNFPGNKRRTHADNIPDSEKPFSCERTPGRSTGRRPGMYQDHPSMG